MAIIDPKFQDFPRYIKLDLSFYRDGREFPSQDTTDRRDRFCRVHGSFPIARNGLGLCPGRSDFMSKEDENLCIGTADLSASRQDDERGLLSRVCKNSFFSRFPVINE